MFVQSSKAKLFPLHWPTPPHCSNAHSYFDCGDTLHITLSGVDKRAVSKRAVFADVPPERKPERGYVCQNHPFTKPPLYLPVTLGISGVDKRVVSKRVVSADVPPERKPERGYVRRNHPFTKPPFYLPMTLGISGRIKPAPNRGCHSV